MVKILGTSFPRYAGVGVGYVYSASPGETAAAELLRARGWSVSPPPCPLCHGLGSVNESWSESGSGSDDDPIRYEVTSSPCPNGCATPMFVY